MSKRMIMVGLTMVMMVVVASAGWGAATLDDVAKEVAAMRVEVAGIKSDIGWLRVMGIAVVTLIAGLFYFVFDISRSLRLPKEERVAKLEAFMERMKEHVRVIDEKLHLPQTILIFLICFTLLASAGWGAVPEKITFSGRLTDSAGKVVTSVGGMTFKFYDNQSGGTQLGSTISLGSRDLPNGIINTTLDVPSSVFQNDNVWLEVSFTPVGGTETTLSRQQIVSVPYAYRAAVADTAVAAGGWTTDGSTKATTPYKVGIGTTEPTQTLEVAGDVKLGNRLYFTDSNKNSQAVLRLDQYNDVTLWNPVGGDDDDIYFGTKNIEPTNIRMIVKGSGNVGIGTASPANKLTVAGNADFTGSVGIGTTSPGAKLHVAGGQVYAETDASLDAVYGKCSNKTNISDKAGVYGLYNGTVRGYGVYANWDGADTDNGAAVWAVTHYGTDGNPYGALAVNEVIGGTATKIGVDGMSVAGNGVRGTSTSGVGVYASSSSGPGVYATSGSSTNAAVYAANSGGGPALEIGNGYLKINRPLSREVTFGDSPQYVTVDGVVGEISCYIGQPGVLTLSVRNKYVKQNSLIFLSVQEEQPDNPYISYWLRDRGSGYFVIKLKASDANAIRHCLINFLVIN